jgi:hypothetical protein
MSISSFVADTCEMGPGELRMGILHLKADLPAALRDANDLAVHNRWLRFACTPAKFRCPSGAGRPGLAMFPRPSGTPMVARAWPVAALRLHTG